MKEFLKNIIPQTMFYLGAFGQIVGAKLMEKGLLLHMKFETNTGRKLLEMKAAYDAFGVAFSKAAQAKPEKNTLRETLVGEEPKEESEKEKLSGGVYVLPDSKGKN